MNFHYNERTFFIPALRRTWACKFWRCFSGAENFSFHPAGMLYTSLGDSQNIYWFECYARRMLRYKYIQQRSDLALVYFVLKTNDSRLLKM